VVATDGTAVDTFLLAPRGSFDITRRNLFGKNRSISLFVSVAANRLGLQPGVEVDASNNPTEYRVVETYREPRLFNSAFDAFVNVVFEQQIRSTFDFTRRTVGGSVARRFPHGYTFTGSYQLQWTHVFNEDVAPEDQLLIDRLFPQSLLSSFTFAANRDKRNDPVEPTSGTFSSVTAQIAAKAIGSEVGFVKSYFTTQAFHQIAPGFVLAGNAALGVANGIGTAGQLLASERFFAGGDTTNRGFPIDQLGIRHVPAEPGHDTIDENGSAIGGNGVMLLMGELRAHVIGGLGVAGFIDTGNVFAVVSDINPNEFRTSIGGGIRYKSPIGPLRVDLGFKVHPQPGEGLTAWFISFGQAF
jgi:outer membrane protein insertion porin family